MRTTLDLDEKLVSELKATEAKTKTKAIHLAMSDLIRHKKLDRLKGLIGKVNIAYVRPAQRKAEQRRRAKS
ncbi:type II toxin-antitoxin system VapB family antitoxin [Candidatus Nitrospira salsa]